MANYPTSAYGPASVSGGQTIQPADINNPNAEITAIETALLSSGLAHDLKFVDATYDIGKLGATRPRHYFGSGNMTIGGAFGVTGIATFTAQDVHSGGISSADDLVFSADKIIRRNTADGSDSGTLWITGGGNNSGSASTMQTQGPVIRLGGNESAISGAIQLYAGNVSGSAISFISAANTTMFQITGAGVATSPAIRDDTTASAANVFIDSSSGELKRSTSSARYKTNIEPMADGDWRWLLDITPVTFHTKESPDGRRFGGLLAEDVAENGPRFAGQPIYAGLDPDGRPDDVAYGHLTAPIIRAIQELAMRIDRLEGVA